MQTPLLGRLLVCAPPATLVLFALMAATSGIASQLMSVPEASEPGANVATRVFVACAVNATLLTYTILRSAASGWRLWSLLFVLYFGITAFMTQNETLYFNRALEVPASVVRGYLAAAFVTAAVFAVGIGAWIERRRPEPPGEVCTPVTQHGRVWKVALLSCVFYPLLYFGFGYFVLWQNEAARLLYQGSTELLSATEHFRETFRDDPLLYPWQCLRGLVWVGLAALVMRSATARWLETAVIVGLLFGLLMNTQLLIPNPFMPPEVRLWHFIETASSNFLLGVGIVWLLHR